MIRPRKEREMAKKVNVIGTKPKRIRVTDKPQRRIDPDEMAAALSAQRCAERIGVNIDPISLAELGTELLRRLHSNGGRPALADATELCRVPLTTEDVQALKTISEEIKKSTGLKPSSGQIVSIILKKCLATGTAPSNVQGLPPSKTPWPENGNRKKYRAVFEIVSDSKSTWAPPDGKAA